MKSEYLSVRSRVYLCITLYYIASDNLCLLVNLLNLNETRKVLDRFKDKIILNELGFGVNLLQVQKNYLNTVSTDCSNGRNRIR